VSVGVADGLSLSLSLSVGVEVGDCGGVVGVGE
jgi:hypothetical protein